MVRPDQVHSGLSGDFFSAALDGAFEGLLCEAHQRRLEELLLDLRARLRGDVSSLANSALSHGTDTSEAGRAPADIADLGNNMLEENNSLLLMDNEEEALQQVEGALRPLSLLALVWPWG